MFVGISYATVLYLLSRFSEQEGAEQQTHFLSFSFHLQKTRSISSDLAEWLERLTVNAVVATVLCTTPASFDTIELEHKKKKSKNPPFKKLNRKCQPHKNMFFRGKTPDFLVESFFSRKVHYVEQCFSQEAEGIVLQIVEQLYLPTEPPVSPFCLRKIRDCVQRKTWCMGSYTEVDYNSPYLIVNSVVGYPPPLPRERGGVGKISLIG